MQNNELSLYNKLVILAYLNSGEKEKVLLVKDTYNLPDFTQDDTNTEKYILYTEYEKMYDALNTTWDGYSNLFNSVF